MFLPFLFIKITRNYIKLANNTCTKSKQHANSKQLSDFEWDKIIAESRNFFSGK